MTQNSNGIDLPLFLINILTYTILMKYLQALFYKHPCQRKERELEELVSTITLKWWRLNKKMVRDSMWSNKILNRKSKKFISKLSLTTIDNKIDKI
jgi:hypothetical protein